MIRGAFDGNIKYIKLHVRLSEIFDRTERHVSIFLYAIFKQVLR